MLIDLQHITRDYGARRALDDITLRLPEGRIGLLGPNGAGKSTLLKIMLGLLAPTSGSGTVFGHVLAPAEHDQSLGRSIGRSVTELGGELFGSGSVLRRTIGYMPEGETLVPGMTGAAFVALAGELYGMPRNQALRRAHEVLTYL